MYKEIKDEELAEKFNNSDLFNRLNCHDSYLEIVVKLTKDKPTFFCNFYEYIKPLPSRYLGEPVSPRDFSKEVKDFIKIAKDNKDMLMGQFSPYSEYTGEFEFDDNVSNLEIVINSSEQHEGSDGLLIIVI